MKAVRIAPIGAVGLLWLLLICLCDARARAHKPSDSYLTIHGGGEQLVAKWDIAIKDLEFVISLDVDQDGEITWGELKTRRQEITAHALSRLQLMANDRSCSLAVTELLVTQHSDGTYAVLMLQTDCPGDVSRLNIRYNLLFDVDPTHRGLILYKNDAVASTHVLSPNTKTLEIRTGEVRLWQTFQAYVHEGVWHIWIGFDHQLFLLTLLLPAVLVLRQRQWYPVETFGSACVSVLKVVTMFTLAHSITLWLAVMEYVTLPSQLVETSIALSIVITAVNNLYPLLPLSNWSIAFVFGLVHGFGFANVLLDLGLTNVALALSLLGFNVGVELGQIAIVLICLPVIYALRSTSAYRLLLFRAGSALIGLVALIWMFERIANRVVLGF